MMFRSKFRRRAMVWRATCGRNLLRKSSLIFSTLLWIVLLSSSVPQGAQLQRAQSRPTIPPSGPKIQLSRLYRQTVFVWISWLWRRYLHDFRLRCKAECSDFFALDNRVQEVVLFSCTVAKNELVTVCGFLSIFCVHLLILQLFFIKISRMAIWKTSVTEIQRVSREIRLSSRIFSWSFSTVSLENDSLQHLRKFLISILDCPCTFNNSIHKYLIKIKNHQF